MTQGRGAGGSRYAWFVTPYLVNKEHWYDTREGAGGSRYTCTWFVTPYLVNKEHWYVDISYFLYFTLV